MRLFSRNRVVSVSASSSSSNTSFSAPASSSYIKSFPNTVSPSPPKTKPALRFRAKVSACVNKVLRRPHREPSASTPIEFECFNMTRDKGWCLICPYYVKTLQESVSTDLSPVACPTLGSTSHGECTEAKEVLPVADHESVTSRSGLFTRSNTRSDDEETRLLSSNDSSSDDSHQHDNVFVPCRIPIPSYPSSSNTSFRRINPMNALYYPPASDSSSSGFCPSLDAADSISKRDSLDYKSFMESQEEILQKHCASLPQSFLLEEPAETRFIFGSPPPLNPSISPNGSPSDRVSSRVASRQGTSQASILLDSCFRQIQTAVTRRCARSVLMSQS